MIFLGAHYSLPFLVNRCRVVIDATFPGLTMSLIREIAAREQEVWVREIAEEMRRDFPTIWAAGISSKAISEQTQALPPFGSQTIGVSSLVSPPLH